MVNVTVLVAVEALNVVVPQLRGVVAPNDKEVPFVCVQLPVQVSVPVTVTTPPV